MSIKYTVWGCQFKCGCKHFKTIKGAKKHEARCWYNPDVKSCVTCLYGHEEMEDFLYRVCDCRKIHPDAIGFIKAHRRDRDLPNINCPWWEGKEGSDVS